MENLNLDNKCVFLGYKSNSKGYKLWYPKQVIINRDVISDESAILQDLTSTSSIYTISTN